MAKTGRSDKKVFKPVHTCGGIIKMFGVSTGGHTKMVARCLKCGAEARKIKDLAITMY